MVSPLIANETYPKKDFTSITQTGLKAYLLAVHHQAAIDPRVPQGTVAGLDEDLVNLGVVVAAAKQVRDESRSATVEQQAALAYGYAAVRSIRGALRDADAPREIQRAYGVGQSTRLACVRDVSAAIKQILDRVATHGAEAAAFGILPENVDVLRAALTAITEANATQEKKRASAPLTTKERNRTANRILKAIRRIAGAGKIAFAHSPVELASFVALVAGPQKKATPKKELAPKEPAPKEPAPKEPASKAEAPKALEAGRPPGCLANEVHERLRDGDSTWVSRSGQAPSAPARPANHSQVVRRAGPRRLRPRAVDPGAAVGGAAGAPRGVPSLAPHRSPGAGPQASPRSVPRPDPG